jgi:hypothetical protein
MEWTVVASQLSLRLETGFPIIFHANLEFRQSGSLPTAAGIIIGGSYRGSSGRETAFSPPGDGYAFLLDKDSAGRFPSSVSSSEKSIVQIDEEKTEPFRRTRSTDFPICACLSFTFHSRSVRFCRS